MSKYRFIDIKIYQKHRKIHPDRVDFFVISVFRS